MHFHISIRQPKKEAASIKATEEKSCIYKATEERSSICAERSKGKTKRGEKMQI
jgi:hypothetical protein